MKATDQALVRVELLLRCWGGGGAVDSVALVISDSPMLLALLEKQSGVDDFMPLELYSELSFEPPSAALHGYFNRAAGYRLRETLEESIGHQWHWLPPRRHRTPSSSSGGAGRVRIPVHRLWFAWDGAEPRPASEQDLKTFATEHPPVDRVQGFCNDRLLVMLVARELLDTLEGSTQSELPHVVANFLANSKAW